MSDEPVILVPRFHVDGTWREGRYLFSDGHMLDVVSPYNSDSRERDVVLARAHELWGTDASRKIAGYALLYNLRHTVQEESFDRIVVVEPTPAKPRAPRKKAGT